MNCIIIDDESSARAIIKQLCNSIGEVDVIEEFDNAIDAIKFLNQHEIDVVFLDLHMPGFSGIDFLQTLKNPPKVAMTTSDTEFAIASYEYEMIVDYLVKPITIDRFEKCIQKIKNSAGVQQNPSISENENSLGKDLYINIDRRLIKLKYADILLVEAKGDYINIKTISKDYLVHTTLKKLKAKLPEDLFLQIHRSYIINFSKIIDIEDNSVLIEKSVIPISRSNRPELMRKLNLL